MKKSIITLLLCSLFATMIFGSCSTDKQKNNDPSTDNSTQNSDSVSTPGNNANVPAYGEKTVEKKEEIAIPNELRVTQSISKIKYLKGLPTVDTTRAEYNTEEVLNKKRESAQRYLDLLGIKEETEVSFNKFYDANFTAGGYDFKAGKNYVSVDFSSVPFGMNASDSEIINFMKSNKYLAALAKNSEVDLNNAYVDREDLGTEDDANTSYHARTFTICSKKSTPAEQAFELAAYRVSFTLINSANSSSKKIHFSGRWTDEEDIIEVPSAAISLTDAKRQADSSVQSPDSTLGSVSNKENAQCSFVYDSSIKPGYSIPCYRFYYETDKTYVVTADVPCIDTTKLPDLI